MKEFLRKIKIDYLVSSLLCIILGVVFIIWKTAVLDVMGSAFAIVLIIIGLIYLSSYFLGSITNGFSALMGAVVLTIGIWFLIQPSIVVSIIPIVIGVVLIFHGVRGLIETMTAKKYGYNGWTINMVLAILSILLGIICVTNAFGIMQNAIVVVGVILIYNGLSNIWISTRSTKAERVYTKSQTIDVEFVEDRNDSDASDGI